MGVCQMRPPSLRRSAVTRPPVPSEATKTRPPPATAPTVNGPSPRRRQNVAPLRVSSAYTHRSVEVIRVTRDETAGRLDTPRPALVRHIRRGSASSVSPTEGARVGARRYSRASTGKSRGTWCDVDAQAALTPINAENSLPDHVGNRHNINDIVIRAYRGAARVRRSRRLRSG